MEEKVLLLFDGISCPVLVTDSMDNVIFKNKIAKKHFAAPRMGHSIKNRIAPNSINIIGDDSIGTEIHTLVEGASIYKRALVFPIGQGTEYSKIWLFDFTLQMIKPEMAHTFLYSASKALSPLINKIIETNISAEEVLGESWNAPMHKLSAMLNNSLKNLYFTNTHTMCKTDELCESLQREILSKFASLGITCSGHQMNFTREPVYVDYYIYTMLFVRVLLMIISKNTGNIIDISYIKDKTCLRTNISFAAKLSDPSTRFGTIAELNSLFINNRLDIAMIDSIVKGTQGVKFFFEVRRGDMKNVSLIFDMPVKSIPGQKLRQTPNITDIDFAGFMELIAKIIRG